MSTVVTSSPRGASSSQGADIESLRCPGETTALVLCIASNVVVLALAVAIVLAGSDWLETHPFIAKRADWVRAILLTALVALPAAPIGRHFRVHAARANGVRVGAEQFPALHDQLLRACRMLGLDDVPEVYVWTGIEGPSAAYAAKGGRSVIVLNAELFSKEWEEGIDWLTFALAGALGSIRLGHTRWWVELLTVYARRIPGLRTPMFLKWAYSRDRCAAFVAPAGIRGLLVEAVGKDVVPNVRLPAFLAQTEHVNGLWNQLAAIHRKGPLLTARVRALYDAGFFDRTLDEQERGAVVGAT
jgi:hypothetical protein